MTMGQLAARLAGGFLQPIDPEALEGRGERRHLRPLISANSSRSRICPAWCGPQSARSTSFGAPVST